VQETLLRAWQRPEVANDTERSARSWLYLQGWTTAQIAADLRIADGTVKSRLLTHYEHCGSHCAKWVTPHTFRTPGKPLLANGVAVFTTALRSTAIHFIDGDAETRTTPAMAGRAVDGESCSRPTWLASYGGRLLFGSGPG
jgi:hypothetical protein